MPDITLVRPDGSKLTVDPKQAARLKLLGYKEETVEQHIQDAYEASVKETFSSPGQQVATGIEGLASGASLGLIDPLISSPGTQQRAKYNPGIRIGSEVVGAILPALATAGGSAPGSAASVLGRATLSGQVASRAGSLGRSIGGVKGALAAGAIEGSIAGAGSAISQATLSGDPLTAESVLASAGIGTLFGAGGAAAGESLGLFAKSLKNEARAVDDISTASKRAGDAGLDSFYKSLPEETPRKTTKGIPKASEDFDYIEQVNREVPSYSPVDDGSYSRFHSAVQDFNGNISTLTKDVDAKLDLANKDVLNYMKSLERNADSLFQDVRHAEQEATALAENATEKYGIKAEFQPLRQAYKDLRSAMKAEPEKAASLLKRFRQSIKEHEQFSGYRSAGLTPLNLPGLPSAVQKAEELVALRTAAKSLASLPDNPQAFFKMGKDKLERVAAALDTASKRTEFRHISDAVDTMVESVGLDITGSPGTRLRAAWEAGPSRTRQQVGTKSVKGSRFRMEPDIEPEIPTGTRTSSAGELPKKPEFPEIIAEDGEVVLPGELRKARSGVSGFWKRAARMGGSRYASSTAKQAGLGIVGSSLAYGLGGSAVTSFLGGGFLAGIAGARGAVSGRIKDAVAKYGPGLGRGIKAAAPRVQPLLVKLDGSISKEEKSRREMLKDRIDEIIQAGPTFNDRAFKVVEPLIGIHPDFANSVHQSAVTAFNMLIEFMPKDPGLAYSRLKSLWQPTELQAVQFGKVLEVFHQPLEVVARMLETGKVDAVQAKALRTGYPAVFQQMQDELVARLPDILPTMSYQDQASLSILTDIPIHSSFSSRSIAQQQSMYLEEPREPRPSSGSSGKSGGRPAKQEPPTAGQSLLV